MKDTYEIHFRCTNCGFHSATPNTMMKVPIGITIEDWLNQKKCTNCGCATLRKN